MPIRGKQRGTDRDKQRCHPHTQAGHGSTVEIVRVVMRSDGKPWLGRALLTRALLRAYRVLLRSRDFSVCRRANGPLRSSNDLSACLRTRLRFPTVCRTQGTIAWRRAGLPPPPRLRGSTPLFAWAATWVRSMLLPRRLKVALRLGLGLGLSSGVVPLLGYDLNGITGFGDRVHQTGYVVRDYSARWEVDAKVVLLQLRVHDDRLDIGFEGGSVDISADSYLLFPLRGYPHFLAA
jgi:hypothetical protein